jgi:branched-chain amino acid transport system permease protein
MSAPTTAAPLPARAHSGRDETIAFVAMTALLIIAPLVVYPFFLMQALCLALFACAFNLLIGYVGLLSFGHAMFLGLAAYVSAHAAKVWGVDPALAVLAGVASATLLGVIAGALAIRRQGIYFAMITLALAQMIYFFCVEAPFTHGEDGIQSVPQGLFLHVLDLSNQTILYYFVLAVFVFGFLVIYRAINSPFGDILKAIRENEPRAVSLGYRVDQYKLAAFVLSAALAGLAGATKAIFAQNASLSDVQFSASGEVVLMTLLGGMGTIYGPVVGAVLIVAMQQYLGQYLGQWVMVIQGAIFIVVVLLFRRGIVGEIATYFKLSL